MGEFFHSLVKNEVGLTVGRYDAHAHILSAMEAFSQADG